MDQSLQVHNPDLSPVSVLNLLNKFDRLEPWIPAITLTKFNRFQHLKRDANIVSCVAIVLKKPKLSIAGHIVVPLLKVHERLVKALNSVLD